MPISVFCHVCNHGNNKNSLKAVFYANKEGSKRNSGLWKIISENCGFHGKKPIESGEIIEFGNYGNKQDCIKVLFFLL